MGRVVKARPRPFYPRERPGTFVKILLLLLLLLIIIIIISNATKQSLSSQTDSRITFQKYPTSYATRKSKSVLTSTRQWNLFWIPLSHPIFVSSVSILSSYICIWLRHCATSRKVAVSIPDGVTGIFHPTGRTLALGSASNRNEYQEYYMVG